MRALNNKKSKNVRPQKAYKATRNYSIHFRVGTTG